MAEPEDESGRPTGSCNCAPNSGAHECPVHTQEDWLSASTGHSPSRLCEPPEPVGVHPGMSERDEIAALFEQEIRMFATSRGSWKASELAEHLTRYVLAERDRRTAAKTVREAADALRAQMDRFPQKGRHTRAGWAVERLGWIADEIEAGSWP